MPLKSPSKVGWLIRIALTVGDCWRSRWPSQGGGGGGGGGSAPLGVEILRKVCL